MTGIVPVLGLHRLVRERTTWACAGCGWAFIDVDRVTATEAWGQAHRSTPSVPPSSASHGSAHTQQPDDTPKPQNGAEHCLCEACTPDIEDVQRQLEGADAAVRIRLGSRTSEEVVAVSDWLDAIEADHSPTTEIGLCAACGQGIPCDALTAVAAVRERDAALADRVGDTNRLMHLFPDRTTDGTLHHAVLIAESEIRNLRAALARVVELSDALAAIPEHRTMAARIRAALAGEDS